MEWRLFADVRERAGTSSVPIESDPDTVEEALQALVERHPSLTERVFDENETLAEDLTVLVNGTTVSDLSQEVTADDELALFPPVSGG